MLAAARSDCATFQPRVRGIAGEPERACRFLPGEAERVRAGEWPGHGAEPGGVRSVARRRPGRPGAPRHAPDAHGRRGPQRAARHAAQR